MSENKANILIIDDDREFLKNISEGWRNVYKVSPCISVKQAREALQRYENANNRTFDLVLLDLVFGVQEENPSGLKLLEDLQLSYKHLPVIIITNHGSDKFLMKAMRQGAVHFFRKQEMNTREWKAVIDLEIKNAKQQLLRTSSIEVEQESSANNDVVAHKEPQVDRKTTKETPVERHPFIGASPQIISIREQLEALAEEPDISVLLLGETGVGKEVAARYLHTHGPRANQPFKAVNLVAIGSEVLESILFGHKKGSFTGATADFKGAVEEADGGVLFLDEIGEINSLIQQKLLRFLEDKVITPLGGKEKEVDVQIVTATNRDLKAEVEKGNFRLDLYHRLNDYAIQIPPLRERQEDITLIATYYLESKAQSAGVFTDEVWQYFLRYSWPGNVRELVSLIKRLLLKLRLAKGADRIDASFLAQDFKMPVSLGTAQIVGDKTEVALSFAEETAVSELRKIEAALIQYRNKSAVVKALGFKNQDQLRYRIEDNYFKKFPHLFRSFPEICKKYKLSE